MEYNDDTYIFGIWFAEKEGYGNIQLYLIKGEEPNSWEGILNFRYYVDSEIFNSEDKRSQHGFKIENAPEEEIQEKVDALFKKISLPYTFKDTLIIKGGLDKLYEASQTSSWLHVSKEKLSKELS